MTSPNLRLSALALLLAVMVGASGCAALPTAGNGPTDGTSASSESVDGAESPADGSDDPADADGTEDAGDSGNDTGGSDDAAGDDGQTTAEACLLVTEAILGAESALEGVDENDASAVVEGIRASAEELASLGAEITNDEVAALLPDLGQMYLDAADAMEAFAAGDTSKMEDLAAAETPERFHEVCGS